MRARSPRRSRISSIFPRSRCCSPHERSEMREQAPDVAVLIRATRTSKNSIPLSIRDLPVRRDNERATGIPHEESTMRFMVIVKATKESEAGKMPSEEMLGAMAKFNEELVKAGVMLDGAG